MARAAVAVKTASAANATGHRMARFTLQRDGSTLASTSVGATINHLDRSPRHVTSPRPSAAVIDTPATVVCSTARGHDAGAFLRSTNAHCWLALRHGRPHPHRAR